MDNININAIDTSEQETPIFSLSISITGTKLIVDPEQLSIISTAATGNENCQNWLCKMQNCIERTYEEMTDFLGAFLSEIFGEVELNNTECNSKSSSFFFGGDE